jgi:hypothetical protein
MSRYRPSPATHVVRGCFRVSTRVSKAHMAYAFPLRPWVCRPLGFLKPGPRGPCRQTLRASSPALSRHFSGLPQTALPRVENCADTASHTRLLDSVRGPSACPSGGTLLFAKISLNVRKTLPRLPKAPPSGFGYPLGGVSNRCPRESVSTPHALGLCSSGLLSGPATQTRFPMPVPPLRFPAKPFDLAVALRRLSFAGPAEPSALGRSFKPEWGHGPPELLHLSGLPSLDSWKSTCLFRSPHALASSASYETEKPAPQGVPSHEAALPLFRRAPTHLVFPTDRRLPFL